MDLLKFFNNKRTGKAEREFQVLLGLVDCYIKTGKPIGSNTLKDTGFEELSSATIRNYFSSLEEKGFLVQQHVSGGRVPTHSAYRAFAQEQATQTHSTPLSLEIQNALDSLRTMEMRELANYLHHAAETLSTLTRCAVFLSAPRFDQDYVVEMKLLPLDSRRCLCVIMTDFGVVLTELLQIETKLTTFAAKRIESYLHWKLTGLDRPESFEPDEETLAQHIYQEAMIRYLVYYTQFTDPDFLRTGFSKLLDHSDFCDPAVLASSLSLFENTHNLRLLVKECSKHEQLKWWIGDDLSSYAPSTPQCTVIAIPYYIGQKIAGAVGIMGPVRIPYQEFFGIMKLFSASISEALTRSLYKFKITFRQPQTDLNEGYKLLMDNSQLLCLENQPTVVRRPHAV